MSVKTSKNGISPFALLLSGIFVKFLWQCVCFVFSGKNLRNFTFKTTVKFETKLVSICNLPIKSPIKPAPDCGKIVPVIVEIQK